MYAGRKRGRRGSCTGASRLDLDGGGENSLVGILDLVESVGNEMFLNITHPTTPLIARMPPQILPASGSPVRLGYAVEHLHFFDPASERRID